MALFLIGLGLGDEKDISVKGLELVKQADRVLLENYTSTLGVDKESLERFYGKPITLADRAMIEQQAEEILQQALSQDVAILVVGDPFGATTHSDLMLRAAARGVDVRVVHNASILNAVGVVGLQLYKYGRTVSVPYPEGRTLTSVKEAIQENKQRGLHTLCLLDIKVNEPSKEELRAGKTSGSGERFMTINEALVILLELGAVTNDTVVVGVARLGQDSQVIRAGAVSELSTHDFGAPLHCLIVPGKLHVVEEEALALWSLP